MNPRRTQLFLDGEIIEQTVRLQRIIHQPQKHPGNPLYTVGAPWEGEGMVYLAGVYIDPQDRPLESLVRHALSHPPTRRSSTPSA